eukprot:gene10903-11057_t
MELSKTREEADKQLLHAAATAFVTQIQEAQQLVLQAVKSAAPERKFEGNNYFAMVQEEPDTSAEDVMLVDGLEQSLGLLAPPGDDQ